jgi:hypothetical protein
MDPNNNPPPPPPPVSQVITVSIVAPTQGAVIKQSTDSLGTSVCPVASAISNTQGSMSGSSLVYTIDGNPVSGCVNLSIGSHTLSATVASVPNGATVVPASATFTITPLTITGFAVIRTMTGEHCPVGGRVVVGDSGSVQDSTSVNSTGTCAFSVNTRLAGSANIRVVFHGDPNMIEVIAHVDSSYFGHLTLLSLSLVPADLAIPFNGLFVGQSLVPNLDLPYLPSGDAAGTSYFYRFHRTDLPGNPWQYLVADFAQYPVAQQFCRNSSNQPVTSSDSVGFEGQMATFDQTFGRQSFRFNSTANTCVTGIGRRLYVDSTVSKVPGANVSNMVTWTYTGSYFNFGVEFAISDQFTVHHESIHSLGFGHTCAWKSIMYTGCSVDKASQFITVNDVLWFYVMQTMADGQRIHGTPFGLPQVHQGWRHTHGETEEPVLVYGPTSASASVAMARFLATVNRSN